MKVNFLLTCLAIVLLPFFVWAQTLTGPNYKVENSTLDFGGETGSSTNYTSVDSVSSEDGDASSSTNYKSFFGFLASAFPGVPGIPTLTNTGGTLYGSLDFIIATGGNQTDTNYAIAISPDDFVTTYYIQADDTIATSEAWQTYSGWGSASGERVVGLNPGTTYKIKVKARYGADSETGFSSIASAATSDPSLTVTFFGIASGTAVAGETTTVNTTTNTIPFSSLILDTPSAAAHKVRVSTNATGGYTTTVQHDGELRTASQQIDSVSSSNASPAAWPGGITTGKFGYHTTDSVLCTGNTNRFSGNDTYAALTTTPQEVACNTTGVTNEETSLVYKLQIGALQPVCSYQNIITYITAATY